MSINVTGRSSTTRTPLGPVAKLRVGAVSLSARLADRCGSRLAGKTQTVVYPLQQLPRQVGGSTGSVMEPSHSPFAQMATGLPNHGRFKQSMSAKQIERMLGVS